MIKKSRAAVSTLHYYCLGNEQDSSIRFGKTACPAMMVTEPILAPLRKMALRCFLVC